MSRYVFVVYDRSCHNVTFDFEEALNNAVKYESNLVVFDLIKHQKLFDDYIEESLLDEIDCQLEDSDVFNQVPKSKEIFDKVWAEYKRAEKEREEKIKECTKQRRYKQYLDLKQEFENE